MSALALPLLQSAQHLLLVGLEALDEVPAPEDVRPAGWPSGRSSCSSR